jgi:hypothetical protein
VYVRRLQEVNGDLTPVSKPILRIKTVEKYGVLICEGKCASTIIVNVAQCPTYHLPDLDPRLDPQRFRPDRHKECVVCEQITPWADMMLCDKCNRGWHTFCLIQSHGFREYRSFYMSNVDACRPEWKGPSRIAYARVHGSHPPLYFEEG